MEWHQFFTTVPISQSDLIKRRSVIYSVSYFSIIVLGTKTLRMRTRRNRLSAKQMFPRGSDAVFWRFEMWPTAEPRRIRRPIVDETFFFSVPVRTTGNVEKRKRKRNVVVVVPSVGNASGRSKNSLRRSVKPFGPAWRDKLTPDYSLPPTLPLKTGLPAVARITYHYSGAN